MNDNQYVEKGQRLVQIDPRDYQVAVEHAKADLADAEAAAQASNLNVPVETVNSVHAGIVVGGGRSGRAGRDLRGAEAG